MADGAGTRLRLGQTGHAGDPETPVPTLKTVVEIADLTTGRAVRNLGLKVTTNFGGHGGVGPFAERKKAVAAMPATTGN